MSHLIHVGNTAGDWEAVYVDGKCIHQDSIINSFEWVSFITKYTPSKAESFEVWSRYLLEEQAGYFPDNFIDIPKEVFV